MMMMALSSHQDEEGSIGNTYLHTDPRGLHATSNSHVLEDFSPANVDGIAAALSATHIVDGPVAEKGKHIAYDLVDSLFSDDIPDSLEERCAGCAPQLSSSAISWTDKRSAHDGFSRRTSLNMDHYSRSSAASPDTIWSTADTGRLSSSVPTYTPPSGTYGSTKGTMRHLFPAASPVAPPPPVLTQFCSQSCAPKLRGVVPPPHMLRIVPGVSVNGPDVLMRNPVGFQNIPGSKSPVGNFHSLNGSARWQGEVQDSPSSPRKPRAASTTDSSKPGHHELVLPETEKCVEAMKSLEKLCRQVESDLSKLQPTRRSLTSTNQTQRLPTGRSRLERLLHDQLKGHGKVELLIGRIERLCPVPLHVDASITLDKWLGSIRALQSGLQEETSGRIPCGGSGGRGARRGTHAEDGSLAKGLQLLSHHTTAAHALLVKAVKLLEQDDPPRRSGSFGSADHLADRSSSRSV